MAANIATLINKQDTFELVRDEIASILLLEKDNQKLLAIDEDKNPDLWNFDVCIERSSPWELIEDPTSGEVIRETPLVNVFFDQETFNGIQSNPVEQQRADGVFTIDCLATKVHEKNADGTISRGDELAARDVQRVVRLVRNILMAGFYTYLNMRGVVSQRDIQSVTMFQPNINDRPAQHVIGCRVNVAVNYNEFSPQVEPVELDLVSLQCTRAEDGFLYFTNSFDYNL